MSAENIKIDLPAVPPIATKKPKIVVKPKAKITPPPK
jgi:hypothetical protein